MRKQQGFSLIELLIVVTIILIIAGIAIPNLLRSRIAANEASAVASLRTINTAQVTYVCSYGIVGFASDLKSLGPGSVPGNQVATSTNAILLDGVLGCSTGTGGVPCKKSGYDFNLTATPSVPVVAYAVTANPTTVDSTGKRRFYSDDSNLVHYNLTAIATSADNPL
jgi:type IV pilus assembly protein PilA